MLYLQRKCSSLAELTVAPISPDTSAALANEHGRSREGAGDACRSAPAPTAVVVEKTTAAISAAADGNVIGWIGSLKCDLHEVNRITVDRETVLFESMMAASRTGAR